MSICGNCGGSFVRLRLGLCSPCYQYERAHGRPRPMHVVASRQRKILERRHIQEAMRAACCADVVWLIMRDGGLDYSRCDRPPHHLGAHSGWCGTWMWIDGDNLSLDLVKGVA